MGPERCRSAGPREPAGVSSVPARNNPAIAPASSYAVSADATAFLEYRALKERLTAVRGETVIVPLQVGAKDGNMVAVRLKLPATERRSGAPVRVERGLRCR